MNKLTKTQGFILILFSSGLFISGLLVGQSSGYKKAMDEGIDKIAVSNEVVEQYVLRMNELECEYQDKELSFRGDCNLMRGKVNLNHKMDEFDGYVIEQTAILDGKKKKSIEQCVRDGRVNAIQFIQSYLERRVDNTIPDDYFGEDFEKEILNNNNDFNKMLRIVCGDMEVNLEDKP